MKTEVEVRDIYASNRRKGITIRRHPNGDDPEKIKLFGEYKICSKCREKKHIFNFDFKSRDNPDGTKRRGIQAECGLCRKKQKIKKYNSDPHSYVFRLIQLIIQPSATKKGRKPCTMKNDEFMNEWQKQYEKTGLYCPKTEVLMTYIGGKNVVNTNISIDRINNKIVYQKGNVQFVTNMYNKIKSFYEEKEIDEFCYKRVEIIERLKNG
jgi:hypothetical protein